MKSIQIREVDLHLTNRCNLTCAHCSVDSARTRYAELDTEIWLDIVDQAADLGCRYVDLTGGEPLLHRGAAAVTRRVVDRGMHVELQTNGLLVTERALGPVIDAGLGDLIISIDGPRSVHDRVRGRNGLYVAAIAAVQTAVRLGLRVRVTRVAMDGEPDDDLPGFVRQLEEMGVTKLSINQFSPVTPRHFESWHPRHPAKWLALTTCLDELARTTKMALTYEVGYVTPDRWPSFFNDETRCLIHRRRWFIVRCDGEVFPCYHFVHRLEMSLGNVRHSVLKSIIADGGWASYSGLSATPVGCSSCSFRWSCGGGCPSPGYLQEGDLSVRDPRCRVEDGFIPVCPFVKQKAGTTEFTNIAPYYGPHASTSSDSGDA